MVQIIRFCLLIAFLLSHPVIAQTNTTPPELKPGLPKYHGKSIGFWVDLLVFESISKDGTEIEKGYPEGAKTLVDLTAYQARMKPYRQQANEAIKALGMSGVPYLLERLRTPGDLLDRSSVKDETSTLFVEISPRVKRGQAAEALLLLVPLAEQIIPELEKLLKTPNLDPNVRGAVRYTLSALVQRSQPLLRETK